jgi:hypothetical protein
MIPLWQVDKEHGYAASDVTTAEETSGLALSTPPSSASDDDASVANLTMDEGVDLRLGRPFNTHIAEALVALSTSFGHTAGAERIDLNAELRQGTNQAKPFGGHRVSEGSTPHGKADSVNAASVELNELHSQGACRPCMYVNLSVGCAYGEQCGFCHLPHTRKNRQRLSKSMRQSCKRIAAMSAAMAVEEPTAENIATLKDAIGMALMASVGKEGKMTAQKAQAKLAKLEFSAASLKAAAELRTPST